MVDWACVIERFERCTLPLSEWNHAAHLAVACHYLGTMSFDDAVARVRTNIPRYNASQGIEQTLDGGYHDTLTIFYMHAIAAVLREDGVPDDFSSRVAMVQARFADEQMILRWYSRERIMSWEARTGWLPPDLRPLPG